MLSWCARYRRLTARYERRNDVLHLAGSLVTLRFITPEIGS
jgi:hypothetical protein